MNVVVRNRESVGSSESGSADPRNAVDVIVVGGGGSGLAAAIEAASLGRKVILIEKNPKLGGTTARSIGSITATNTPHQLRKGIRDSPEDHFDDLKRFNAPLGIADNEKLSRLLVENVSETFRWLMSMGIEFYGPMKELPHRKPRMHNVLPNSRAYIFHLERRARRLGVDIRLSTSAKDFVFRGERVVGVVCDSNGRVQQLSARGGVVLCSGDYSANPEKRAKYLPVGMAKVQPANPTNTGEVHDMVTKIGGRILNPHLHLSGIRFQPPPPKWMTLLPPNQWLTRLMNFVLENFGTLMRPVIMSFLTTVLVPSPKMFQSGAILINRRGERFCNEVQNPGPHVADQPDQIAYILLDGTLAKKFDGWPNYVSTAPGFAYASIDDYRRNRSDIFHEAQTLGELAEKIGASLAALEAAVAGDSSGYGQTAIQQPPFIALGPVRYLINFTDGGLAVNERLQVLGREDKPIPGLYAAGFTGMGGVLLEGHGHHLGWAFTSGRLAGRAAAYQMVTADIPEAASAAPAAH